MPSIEEMKAAARQKTADGSFANQGSSSSSGEDDPLVWMGVGYATVSLGSPSPRYTGKELPGGERVGGTTQEQRLDDARPMSQAAGQLYDWNDKQRRTWSELLMSKGLADKGDYSFDTAEKWWQIAVEKSANFYARGKKVAPQQYIQWYATGAGKDGKGPGGGSASDPSEPSTTTSTSTEENVFTDAVSARYVVRKTLENELHRAPTEAEYRRFQDLLHRQEDQPNVSTTVTNTDGKGNTTYNTTHQDDTTDASPEAVADQFARAGKTGKERNTTKIATDYYGAALRLIGG